MAWIIVSGLVLFILIVSVSSALEDDNSGIGLGVGALFFLAMIIFCLAFRDYFYKQGQVDAMNGVVKYKLVRYIDKTVEWEYIYDTVKSR